MNSLARIAGICIVIFCHCTVAQNLIEYRPGTINIILTVPHDGALTPSEFPDRVPGCLDEATGQCAFAGDASCADVSACPIVTVKDEGAMVVAEIAAEVLEELLGGRPHLILSHLNRTKMDPNREVNEAAQNNPFAIDAHNTFHGYIEEAKSMIGRGILIDIHVQGHLQNSSELGYLLSISQLNEGNYDASISGIRTLSEQTGLDGETLMIGPQSLGAFLEMEGFNALPSPRQPSPGTDQYFSGGYIVTAHGSVEGGLVDAIMIETPGEVTAIGGDEMRRAYGEAVGRAIANFFELYYA